MLSKYKHPRWTKEEDKLIRKGKIKKGGSDRNSYFRRTLPGRSNEACMRHLRDITGNLTNRQGHAPGRRYTPISDYILKQTYEARFPIQEIAKALGRTRLSIISRLNRLHGVRLASLNHSRQEKIFTRRFVDKQQNKI